MKDGQLKEGKIGMYKGQFTNGVKHGQGSYFYSTGIRYEGQYLNGFKHGIGTIYNYDNTIAYTGCFTNGLPNGEGYTVSNGNSIYTQFKDGIDVKSLAQID